VATEYMAFIRNSEEIKKVDKIIEGKMRLSDINGKADVVYAVGTTLAYHVADNPTEKLLKLFMKNIGELDCVLSVAIIRVLWEILDSGKEILKQTEEFSKLAKELI